MSDHRTALLEAVNKLKVEDVRRFVPHVPDLDEAVRVLGDAVEDMKFNYDFTWMPTAIKAATEILEILIRYNANLETRDQDYQTLLHRVVNYPDLVQVLIANNANLNAVDDLGWTPLANACYGVKPTNDREGTVNMLLKAGADPNWTGASNDYTEKVTPLMVCCDQWNDTNSHTLIPLLISYGADIQLTDCNHMTALDQAIQNDYLEAAEILISYGATANSLTMQLLEEKIATAGKYYESKNLESWRQIHAHYLNLNIDRNADSQSSEV